MYPSYEVRQVMDIRIITIRIYIQKMLTIWV